MGGEATGCTEETVNVFVESAYWDHVQIALAGRALKINSDARYRFERGIDPAFTLEGLELATQMILDLCGGEASEVVVAGAIPDHSRAYKLDPARVQSLVGMEIPESEQRQTLTRLGFRLEGNIAHVPSWRPDVQGEADLVEEVARIASLTGLQGKPLPRLTEGVPRPVMTSMQRRLQAGRRTSAALGYNECISYSFIDQASAALFGGGDDASMLENPISSEMSHMRPSLLPGLLQAAARNQARGFMDMALFEVGPAFPRWRAAAAARDDRRASGRAHRPARRAWRDAPGGRVRRQGRCRGSAGGHGRAGQGADPARRRGLVASGTARQDLPRAEKGLGRLWRVAPQGSRRDGREGSGDGVCPVPPKRSRCRARPAPRVRRCNCATCRRWSAISPLSSMPRSRR